MAEPLPSGMTAAKGGVDEQTLQQLAVRVLRAAERTNKLIATAESCTGGLIASVLTDQRGYGKWFDRGFVAYTDEAKKELLGVPAETLGRYGAVSAQIAQALARGALTRSRAGIAIGVTGFAGEAGPSDEPGLVFVSVTDRHGHCVVRDFHFGDIGRDATRSRTAAAGLELLTDVLKGRIGFRPETASPFRFAGGRASDTQVVAMSLPPAPQDLRFER